MALTRFQRSLCRLLAQNHIAGGESYIARGAALNELMAAANAIAAGTGVRITELPLTPERVHRAVHAHPTP